jgi:hypothetical protein
MTKYLKPNYSNDILYIFQREVGIATGHGLDDLIRVSVGERIFFFPSRSYRL